MDKNNLKFAAAAVAAAPFLPVVGTVGTAAAIIGSIFIALQTAQEEVKAAESGDASNLEDVVRKQQALIDLQQSMARVAQEVAIANRISQSTDVEIEEFYDQSKAVGGEIGGSVKTQSIKLGANLDNKSVVKRIYKFTGLSPSAV